MRLSERVVGIGVARHTCLGNGNYACIYVTAALYRFMVQPVSYLADNFTPHEPGCHDGFLLEIRNAGNYGNLRGSRKVRDDVCL